MSDILLRNVLGSRFDDMPPSVQRLHSLTATREVTGIAHVSGARNPIAWLIRLVAFLPKPVYRTPIRIQFVKYPNAEGWDRRFGKNRFHTRMEKEGAYMAEHMVQFPVTFVYEVRGTSRGFSLHPVQVRFLGVPLPRFLWPQLSARASEWRGRYRFATRVGFWFCGTVVGYTGYLDV